MTDFDDAAPSRTERKRAALDLQKTGGQLVALRAEDLARIPLGDDLREAIALYQRIRSHEAKRRQLQFIGKLLRGTEMDPVYAALDRINGQSNSVRYAFHQLEQWRERLIDDPRALTEYLNDHPQADRQLLRHQLARIRNAADDAQRKKASRELFRMLRRLEQIE
jgi:ribosome-associated protein